MSHDWFRISNKKLYIFITPFFHLDSIFQLSQMELPLSRKDLEHKTGLQAVVLTREDIEDLGVIDFIHSSGERMMIEPESLKHDDVLILYPEDLGDQE